MRKNSLLKRLLSVVICLALVLAYLPAGMLSAAADDQVLNILKGSKKADASTINNWKIYFGPDKMDTEFAGGVWTDKSVFTGATDDLPGITLNGGNNFLVALSAIASNLSITGHTSAPTDTMLVLDVSGSMVDGTYQVGTIRRGNNNYQTVNGIDMSLIEAMIESTNATIDKLMKQNTNNRVGVVLYSGNTSTNQAATPDTATVILPLGRYTGVEGEYLSIDADYRTEALYARSGWFGTSWQATGESATYVPTDSEVNISLKDGLKTAEGGNVADTSKEVVGGTYIQNGLLQAMEEFLNVKDIVVPEGRPQAGAERLPVLVLMSDGAPTIAASNYNSTGNSNEGDGSGTDDRITFLTQLTAAYVRGRIAAKYQQNANDEQEMLFLTLGLGTENSSAATNTLYPAGSSSTLRGYWSKYLAGAAGANVEVIDRPNSWSVYRDAAVAAMNYVDTYYYASNAEDLINSFEEIVSEISLKAESYATLVEGGSADFSGYVTFEDALGEMMHVADVKGILMSDGNGGKVLYTGKGVAEGMSNGNLGTVDNPTERGDELVRTVRERIPGTTTTQAQQLIANAYADQQLYYLNDNNWSNYIGWYADADGNYVGFWDKDSSIENAPANAVRINKSYGYLGVNGDSDMMHVVVMVSTDLKTQHQTVNFRIPASLVPTVQYKITLDEDDPDVVEKFEREDAIPMTLVFEAGLRPDINSINLEQKIKEHEEKGGHVHRNDDGTVSFYTNEWAIGNDTNKNGIPDPEEVENAKVASSHFHPAMDNTRYYYTEDTMILTGNDSVVTGARPTDTDSDATNGTGYYYNRYIYSANGRKVIKTPIAAITLENDAKQDNAGYWYIPEGTMYHNLGRFQTPKDPNATNTLPYSWYPTVFENGDKQDVYTFLGNNGTFIVEPAQGIALTKTVGEVSEEEGAPTSFTFIVTLSEAVASPVITDTDGNLLSGVATVDGNKITVTLKAGQTVVISGIPTGTGYSVEEVQTKYYTATSANASGTVKKYTVNAVDFVNNAKGYGSLVVSKAVNYPEGFVPGTAHNNMAFPITVTFTGDIAGMIVPAGATQNGNTFTLSLKDGQSATFANIPEGVTYTVTEGELDGGYAFQELRYSDTDKLIDSKDLDEAHVVNSYTLTPVSANVKLTGVKDLVTNESTWGGAEFTVELFRLDNFADEDPTSTGLTATMREDKKSYEINMSSITFDKVGTYYFRAVEVIPEEPIPNVTYDRTAGLFSITVTDEDADGKLEIKNVVGYQATQVSGDANNGWTVTKDFTNVVSTDKVIIKFQKNVVDSVTGEAVNAHRGDITFGLYQVMNKDAAPYLYALTDTTGVAEIAIPVSKDNVQSALNGRIVYFLREIPPAEANRVVGMNYNDSWIYEIEITWDDTTNQAVVKYTTIENDQIQQNNWAVYTEGTTVLEHTNTYEKNVSVEIDLSGKKTLNGKDDLGGREFSFSLYKSTAAFVKGDLIATVKNSGNAIAFNDISFTAPGVYYMAAMENASTLGGITVDPTEYHITVEIEKFVDTDGVTRLRVVEGYPVVVKYGNGAVADDALNFNNTYTVTGSGTVTMGGKKVLNGRALVAGEFAIGLYRDAACTDLIESVFNKADGTFAFSAITYTAANLGADYADATYTYYVKEIPNGKGGVTYDPTVHAVTVKVSHKDGQLVVTSSDNAATLQITNTYEAKPVDVTLNGSKKLSGDWTAVANKDFTFQLFAADADFVITDQTPVKTATVTGNADFSMTLSYEDGQEGVYYFVLKEYIPAEKASGVGYDAGEYHITVSVSDPGDGQLVAQTTVYRPGTGNTTDVTFTNTYTVEPTEITLEGTKSYINSVTGESIAMTEEMFSFVVLENDDLVATGYNLADGTIRFTPIRYTAAGVHTYTVVEMTGDAGGVTYDVETVFTVTVTVTDNGNGTLTAVADYGGTPVKFQNTYTHESAQVTLNGEKTLTGDWSKVPDASKLFNFELYETDASFAVSGTPLDTVASAAGKFTFGTQTYTVPGTHYYVVLEKAGDPDKGITYDAAQYQITVVVEDDGNGNLIPTVTAANATVTVDAQNSRLVTVDGLDFTNDYKTAPVKYTPEAKKSYKGKEMKAFDFVLTVDGNDKQTKQNDELGNVVFDPLTFDAPGEYELKIREQKNILWGLIRWDTNVYTVKLTVEDNGLGQLVVNESKTVISSQKGSTDLIFRNADHDEITKKEVFLISDPVVNIDGKTVEKNDILIYKISYTNYDTVPVDVEIVDTVPQYTTYVAGSADNNGTITGSTLRWNLTAVAPGETVTVTFQVKVAETTDEVVNSATVLEGENQYQTNEVKNPVEEDTLEKDVFLLEAPTVSIDGKTVEKGDVLLYKITYTNADDFAADVTITDTIPQYTTYVTGSADNGAAFADGVLTWELTLDAGETKTVSFQVKVVDTKVTVINQATALDGENTLESNQVRNPVEEDLVTKDVFLVAEPTVSIDGKAVEKGDVLLYKITYTNLDGQAADVTITDTVPQYTAYVDGSADNGGVLADGVLTWKLELAAGESKTVSFQVKVTGAKDQTVANQATALEGENKLESNKVTNPIKEDIIVKDSFLAEAPTVSIDGKTVDEGDVLIYKLTYTNTDDFAADVTITDTIPQHTTYVTGSADNGGVLKDGVLTWKLTLAAGESKTVSFQVKVNDLDGAGATITNKATALEGENTLESNQVTNFVPETFDNPTTGDSMNIGLMAALMLSSVACLAVLLLTRKKVTE